MTYPPSRGLAASSLAAVRLALLACIAFAGSARAAHDLWAVTVLLAAVTLLAIVLTWTKTLANAPLQFPAIEAFAFVFFSLWVSTRASYDISSSILETCGWGIAIAAFYVFWNSLDEPSDIEAFFVRGSFLLVPLAVWCAFEFAQAPAKDVRASLVSSIVLSGFALYWFFIAWSRKERVMYSAPVLAAAIVLLILGRSWWVIPSLAAGFAYYYRRKLAALLASNKPRFWGLCIVGTVCFGLFLFLKIVWATGPHEAASHRLDWWTTAIEMLARHPWTGVGPGSYAAAYPHFQASQLHSRFAHSFPLQWIAETGLLGGLALVILLSTLIKRSSIFTLAHRSKIREALCATLITVAVYSLIQFSLEFLLNKILFLLAIAAVIKSSKHDMSLHKRNDAFLITACLLLLIPAWLKPWVASVQYESGNVFREQGENDSARASYRRSSEINPFAREPDLRLAETYRPAMSRREPLARAYELYYNDRSLRWTLHD